MVLPQLRRPFRLAIAALGAAVFGATAWGLAAMPPAAGPRKPQRIVSLNLCTDQLLLALADRRQIAGLTRNARDPDMSAAAAAARGLPILGSAEQVLAARPDLVIGMPVRHHPFVVALREGDYRALDLGWAESYPAIVASIRTVAAAVGHPARGVALIARMDGDLARLPRARRRPVIAYYQRRGFLTGAGTLIDDLMIRAGAVNLATRLGKPALSQLSLEELTAAAPDYLLVDRATERITDQGTEMLHHPILARIPRIVIPQAWTVCGGPAYVDAARAISEAVAER